MGMNYEVGNYKNLSTSAAVTARGGQLLGFYVNSTNAGTIAFLDGGSSGTSLGGTVTPVIGFHRFPSSFGNGGLYATIGGTALNVTIFYVPAGQI